MKNLLKEGLTDVVYHFTDMLSLYNIIKTNRFYTSIAMGDERESKLSKNYYFYFSTSRGKDKRALGDVRIKLDGRKLSQNYKASPMSDIERFKSWGVKPPMGKTELEDRIVLNKPYIENAMKYIIKVDILTEHFEDGVGYYKQTYDLLEKNNIPYSFYKNEYDFYIANKPFKTYNPPIGTKIEHKPLEQGKFPFEPNHYRLISIIAEGMTDSEILSKFNLNKAQLKKIKEWQRENDYQKYSLVGIVSDLLQPLSIGRDEVSISLLEILVKDMKKLKAKNLSEYIKAKYKND